MSLLEAIAWKLDCLELILDWAPSTMEPKRPPESDGGPTGCVGGTYGPPCRIYFS